MGCSVVRQVWISAVRKNVGVAVGIIDGFVYLGTGVMSLTYGFLLPKEKFDAAGKLTGPVTEPENWVTAHLYDSHRYCWVWTRNTCLECQTQTEAKGTKN